jgi:hypothetical protein
VSTRKSVTSTSLPPSSSRPASGPPGVHAAIGGDAGKAGTSKSWNMRRGKEKETTAATSLAAAKAKAVSDSAGQVR